MQEALAWIQQQGGWLLTQLKELGNTLFKEHQTLLIQIILGIILLYILVKLVKKIIHQWKHREKQIFFRKERVLTRNELRFFKALQQAVADMDLCIFPMLRVSELLRVKKQSSRKKYYKYLNQISRKHIDFTLCRQDNNEIVCCIELQDRPHNKEVRAKRDQFIQELFEKSGMVLLRIPSSSAEYDIASIQEQVKQAMEQNQQYLTQLREQKEKKKKILAAKQEKPEKERPKKKKKPQAKKTSEKVKKTRTQKPNQKEEKSL